MSTPEKLIREALAAGPTAMLHGACVHEIITVLLAELDALRKDAVRLDFLDLELSSDLELFDGTTISLSEKGLREDIDAAMQQEGV